MGIFTSNATRGYYNEDATVELPLPEEVMDNSEEVEDAHSGKIDPDPIVDPVEESFRICAESETNFGRLMMAVGIQELKSYQESGVDYIHEAPNLKAFFTKTKAFFKTLKEKIWSVVKNFIATFQAHVSRGEKFATKYGAQIKKGFAAIKDEDLKVKGFKFTNTEWDAAAIASDLDNVNTTSFLGLAQDFSGTSNSDVDKFIDALKDKQPKSSADMKDSHDKIRGKILNMGPVSATDFSDELYKFFRNGIKDASDLKKSDININRVVDTVLKGGSKSINSIKKNYRTLEKKINEQIKKVEVFERAIVKYDGPKNTSIAMTAIGQSISQAKSTALTMNSFNSAHMSAMKAELSQARRIALRSISKDNAVDKKLFGESAIGGIGEVSFI